jgi:hypothetical protein
MQHIEEKRFDQRRERSHHPADRVEDFAEGVTPERTSDDL